MNYVKDTIEYITKAFQLWITVNPWEKGVRVRYGKHQKILEPGLHFKLPFLDNVYKQTIRIRVVAMPLQTLATKDDKTLTIKAAVGYNITDIQKLYNTVHQPETTITNLVLSEVAKYVSQNVVSNGFARDLELKTLESLKGYDYGVEFNYVRIVGYALVRTFRLIQDQHWEHEGMDLDKKA